MHYLNANYALDPKQFLPPEADFTAHYNTHYEPGIETPTTIDSCELPPCPTDDNLTQEDFDKGVQKLNAKSLMITLHLNLSNMAVLY